MSTTYNVLLLGAGFVVKPTLEILAKSGSNVTVACRTLETATSLSSGIPNTSAISLDVSNEAALDAEVAKHDLVVSLIPYTFHAAVIKSAIRNKKNVVTTSYVSPAMQELNAEAEAAGITVLNEIGLDPGIDHLYAIKTIEEVHAAGGKIKTFLSYCGGLPAPEDSDNPLGYKFSWSPRGVLLAARNNARFWKDGKIEEIDGPKLMDYAKPYHIYPGYAFVAYPNRDSTPYNERYNIPEAENIVRGTLRYQGNPDFVRVLVDVGFLSDSPLEILSKSGTPWNEATAQVIGAPGSSVQQLIDTIVSKSTFVSDSDKERIINGFRWLGLFSNDPITPRGNPLDTLCATLEKKMQYEKGERDFVMLQHKFGIIHADGREETRTSTLVEYGAPYGPGGSSNPDGGYSAMAKLVGVPCAVACQMVLDGRIKKRGILAPLTIDIAQPLMDELREKYGIEMIEKTIA